MNFGQRLRSLREGKKITQKELSKVLNVSESAVGMYERGEREPNFETVDKIANFFDVQADYLLGRANDPSPTITHNKELAAESDIYIAYLGGPPEEMDEEEAEHLKRELEMFRAFKEKRKKEREQQGK